MTTYNKAGVTPEVIARYIARIRPKHAEILRAAAGNASYIHLAATLRLPLGTVKSRLNRARMAIAMLAIKEAGNDRTV